MMRVEIKPSDPARVRRLKERFSLSLLAATVLERRGIDSDEEMMFTLESDAVYLHSPFECDDVFSAVDRIGDAIESDERILIFGDRDVDGVTAVAIMYRGLKEAGAKDVSTRLPRGDEPYGLTLAQVAEIQEKGYSLVITVDCGISAIEEVRTLERSGIDVIVLDHHIPGEELPPAAAIFDPLVPGCGYPFTGLAGCAVAAKMVWALKFSQTDFYSSECILLHAEPRNGTIRINAVRLENLIETDRISEELVEGAMSIERTRLMDFLAVGLPVFVLDGDTERNMLRKAFGSGVDISLIDIRQRLDSIMPSARGRSLFDLAMLSRAVRYRDGDREMEALLSLFRSMAFYSEPSLSSGFDRYLQLAAIGTTADLMPMRNENKIIVRRGLRLLGERPLECLKPLLGRQNLAGKRLNTRDISFYVAPVINAAGRMGDPDTALSLLLCDDIREAEALTDRLLELNRKRQKGEEDALSLIAGKAAESKEALGGKMIIVSDSRIPRGLTGALASKLQKEHSVPAIVMADVNNERISASMRCSEEHDAKAFLSSFSSLFDDYGGHRCAAGFSMPHDRKEILLQMMEGVVMSMDESEAEGGELTADATIPPDYMTMGLWRLSSLLEPFGQENEALRLLIRNAVITDIASAKPDQKLMRFSLRYGVYAWPAVWWTPHDRERFRKGMHVDVLFTPDVNFWKGVEKEQLSIVDMEESDA